MSKQGFDWPRGQSRYKVLADRLMSQIEQGEFRPGDFLPGEAQLCSGYGVSRFTARQAIQELQRRGLIATHHGIGSEVIRVKPSDGQFGFSFDSVDQFLEAAKDLKFEMIDAGLRRAGEEVAENLQIGEKDEYLFVEACRVTKKDGEPVAGVELHIPEPYVGIKNVLGHRRAAISQLIEDKYNVRTSQIHQTIEPVALGRHFADLFKLPVRSPGLLVCRTYIDAVKGAFLHVRNIHAGKYARLSMGIRRNPE